ncbi:MAG TPA: PKD domain-containing protein, partial [Bdellovibrionales bacterium]|nr:PKD domain-containing protein [Bdellovibrionales bacterium]
MKNAKRLLFASVLFVSLGCSKTGVGGDQMSSTLNSQQKCSEAAKKAGSDPDKLKIEGGGNVAPGDAAHYRLSEDLSCATDKTVEWHTVAGGRSVANTGTSFVSSFSKPGEYVVAAQISTAGSSQTHEVSAKTVVATQVALNGPQVGMAELEHHYELVVPAGVILASAAWNFGDGSPVVNSLAAQDHTFWAVGQYTVTVTVVTNAGETQTISQSIKVLAPTDGMECVRDLTTSGPTEGVVNQPVTMSVYIPPCMTIRMRALSWNFGDGTARDANQTVQHAYTSAGTYNVSLDIFTTASATVPLVTLTRTIEIVAVDVEPEPEPEPQPGQCATLGQTRESNGDIYTEEKECGINGKRTDSYRDRIVETCQQVGTLKKWMETSRSKELLNEGACEGMSCELPAEAMTGVDAILMGIVQVNGKYYLLDGGSKTFYSSQSPAGNCSEVAQLRRCDNGVFSGSSTHKFLLCNNGCEGVGPHGTVQSGVIVGETKVPKACEYGETGIFDTFHTVADKTCDRGTVTTSNTRTGGLKTGGVCPTYGWQPSEAYSACSANCGGVQTRIFECKSPLGETVANSRCAGQAPVETRVCDGNPEAVRRSESATVIEDGSASATCPANQIGEVVRKRESTTTKVYACINHAVALESETV